VPASALVGLMLVVVVHTFEWSSVPIVVVTFLPLSARNWLNNTAVFRGRFNVHRKIRRADGAIILLVTMLTILTNLGYAIIAGVVFAALMYSWDSAKALKHSSVTIKRMRTSHPKASKASIPVGYHGVDGVHPSTPSPKADENETATVQMNGVQKPEFVDPEIGDDAEGDDAKSEMVRIYILEGPLMFSNSKRLPSIFNWNADPDVIEIHLQNCTVHDWTAVNQLNDIAAKYKNEGKEVRLKYINIETLKTFEKAKELVPHFSYEMNVEVKEQRGFTAPMTLNVAQGSNRQL